MGLDRLRELVMDRETYRWRSLVGCSPWGRSQTRLSDLTFTFHFHALEKEMATHSSVLAWRIQGTAELGGLPSMGSHRVGHDWRVLAAERPSVLRFMGSQRVRHDWVTELNWTEYSLYGYILHYIYPLIGWRTIWLFPNFGYCEPCCYEHLCTSFFMNICFQLSLVHNLEKKHWDIQ